MGWILNIFKSAVHLGIAVALARRWGPVGGMAIYCLGVGLMTVVAAGLLRSLTVGSVTWRNHLVGWLLPWTWLVGGGSFARFLLKNGVAAVVFGVSLIGLDQLWPYETWGTLDAANATGIVNWATRAVTLSTYAGWAILGGGWLVWLRQSLRWESATRKTHLKRPMLWWLGLGVPSLIGSSVLLRLAGYHGLALGVVAIPLGIVATPALLLLLVCLGHYLTGRPIRWN